MWARVVEIMFGVWLAISPFVFAHDPGNRLLWASDFVCAVLVAMLAALSYWRPTRYAHLLTLAVGCWLVGYGRLGASTPLPPGMQNEIVVGLLLLMFAIVPNAASQPPMEWYRQRRRALSTE